MRLRGTGLRSPQAGPFDIALVAGACLAVTGPSGAGKSLLLRMLADLDAHEGEAWLDGQACSAMPAPAWRRQVRYLPAEPGWWHDTVGPHFAMPAGELLTRLELPSDIMARPVARCSTGERQRLSLLRALLDRPPVLLLDEPTGPLDDHTTGIVESLLRERLTEGTTIVLVTHDLRQAAALGTSHMQILAGRPA